MKVGIDMWMRNGTCVIVQADTSEQLLLIARQIYDSFPEDVWQCLRP